MATAGAGEKAAHQVVGDEGGPDLLLEGRPRATADRRGQGGGHGTREAGPIRLLLDEATAARVAPALRDGGHDVVRIHGLGTVWKPTPEDRATFGRRDRRTGTLR